MHETVTIKGVDIELNFRVPADYRKSFYIDAGEVIMCMEVDGSPVLRVGMNRKCETAGGRPESVVLDWIQDSIETIRKECAKHE